MKKLNKILIVLIMALLCVFPVLTGCEIFFSSARILKTPRIALSESNNCLTWSKIDNADTYAIYSNDQLADEVSSNNNSMFIYDLTSIIEESGTYKFYVIARSASINKTDSAKSNVVTFNYTKKNLIAKETPKESIDLTNKIRLSLTGASLSYIPLTSDQLPAGSENVEYYVYLCSNSTEITSYKLNTVCEDLRANNWISKNEIYAIRIGYNYTKDDENYKVIASDIIYYNPDDNGSYTKQIYLFDGFINDYYINSLQELSNIIYYSFINRMEDFNIKIGDEFKNFVTYSFDGTNFLDKMDRAILYGLNQMYETMFYESSNASNRFCAFNGSYTDINIKISYGGFKECDTTIKPTKSSILSQAGTTPYYERVSYTSLKDKYGEIYAFVSDNQFLYTQVTTSEQLYWAVENKVTPVFEGVNSSAYRIYKRAKEVIKEIISDEMSDYEKALSLFDWISYNTSYDYTSYTTPVYSATVAQYPTLLPCYYLEGVFQRDGSQGYSVCDGFSKAYSLMCNMIGIDCIRVTGDADTGSSKGGHAWNKVYIDTNPLDSQKGKYYLVDITWTEFQSSDNQELLSHTYFGLSDEDVKDSHFQFANRDWKYKKYASPESLYYYDYQKFTNNGTTQNLVVKNTQELTNMFDYMFNSHVGTWEVIVDYNYMVAEYEKVNEKYLSQTGIVEEEIETTSGTIKTQYNKATDVITYLKPQTNVFGWTIGYQELYSIPYYKLTSYFQQNVMKPNKFQEQYLHLNNYSGKTLKYDSQGGTGMLYVIEQSLLIDSDGEVEHLVNALINRNISGEYTIYALNSILDTFSGADMLAKMTNMFSIYTLNKNIDISFEIIEENITDSAGTMTSFKMIVSQK